LESKLPGRGIVHSRPDCLDRSTTRRTPDAGRPHDGDDIFEIAVRHEVGRGQQEQRFGSAEGGLEALRLSQVGLVTPDARRYPGHLSRDGGYLLACSGENLQ
jgi:hypothetical protein